MEPARRAGVVIGVLLLVQMTGGFLVNFVLEAPLFGPPGFLVNAAPHALQLELAVIIGIAIAAIFPGIAITLFPFLRQHSEAMALWLVALVVTGFAVTTLENIDVLSMLSLSQEYARAGPADRDRFEALRAVVASARNWTHYVGRTLDGVTILVLYAALYRFAFVPRALSAFGLLAAVLMISGVALPLFGQPVVFPLLMPLALSQLILAVWLIVRGLRVAASASPGSR